MMNEDTERQCPHHVRVKKKRRFVTLLIVTIASTIWFAIRTGTKPSRLMYPCQQAALTNISLFKSIASASIPSLASIQLITKSMKPALILTILTLGGFVLATSPIYLEFEPLQVDSRINRVPIVLKPQKGNSSQIISDLFFVQNATGPQGNMDSSVNALINLMASQGFHFHNPIGTSTGLIGYNDVIIIKMNGQWNRRGGTNTDLIKSIINAIHNHPDGFTGEIVIADNGQGIGDLDWSSANSYYQNQSAQEVADFFFPEWNVSAFLWDDLRESTVDDYDSGDFTNGYVRSSTWHEDTELFCSYPKFTSPATGAYISFKNGVWVNGTGFLSDRLKIINIPVLKTHELLGVTGCVKHYMGVPQGYVVDDVDSEIPHEHFSVKNGGMGTMMVETRAPVLNILDMIWVNANPLESSINRGPWSSYTAASATDIIGASVDPVALDYWSAKHVLVPTAQYLEHSTYSSLDPDYEPISDHIYSPYIEQEESFHNYLERSMNVMKDAGFQVTMDEQEMNVFVVHMTDAGPITPTTPDDPVRLDYLPIAVGVGGLSIIVIVAVLFMRKRMQ